MQTTFYCVTTLALAMVIGNWFSMAKRDDTDGKDRSGLLLYTDYGTGCQYVGTMTGGLTPRLDKDGKIVCKTIN